MNKWLEILIGLILVVLPVYAILQWQSSWGIAALYFIMGGVIVGLICIGLILLMLGITDLKE